jgi:electron transport complex protein RnfB
MNDDVYRKLAQKLDAIPNGFPQTESGIELKLLAKICTPEEASLASEMRLIPESAEQIAQRIGRDPAETTTRLEEMVRKGLIRVIDEEGQDKFGLMPWVVGVYEEQLGRLDEEFVRLLDRYYLEGALGWVQLFNTLPSIEKVIPVEKSIPVGVQIFPYEQASALLDNAKSFGVRKCICKVNRALVGKPCKYPVEVCLLFAPTEGAFDDQPDTRVITKEEALKILRETEEAGLIHSSTNVREGHFYICNCCTCCCGFMRALSLFGMENSVAKSDFRAKVDPETCTGCGTCVKRCQFGARSLVDDVSSVDQKRCVGCGQCVMTCPSGAMTLVRKLPDQISPTPRDMEEWATERAQNRGISTEEFARAKFNLPVLSDARARIFAGQKEGGRLG